MSLDKQKIVGRVSNSATEGMIRQAVVESEANVGLRSANPTYADDWIEVQLKDVTTVLGDGLHGTPEYDSFGNYYFINGNNLRDGRITVDDKTRRVSMSEYQKYKKNLDDRTILVSINGTLGNVALYHGEKVVLGKSACYFNVKEDTDKQFVRYVITSDFFQTYIHNLATGSTIKNVSLKLMRNFSFKLPPLVLQRQISAILEALDDRIALLRETNATLEAIAQALFKSWFVDFDPVHAKQQGYELEGMDADTAALFPDDFEESAVGLVPKGWKINRVEEVTEKVGMGPFGSNIKVSTFVEQGIPIISGQHLRHTLIEDLSFNFITNEHAEKLKNSCVGQGDVVFTHAGNIGQVSLIHSDTRFKQYVLSQRQFFLRCNKEKMLPAWITYFFRSPQGQHLLLANASQVGVPSIARPVSYLRSIELVVPPITLLLRFAEIVDLLHKQVIANRAQIQTLTTLRDTLLPRLVSGQLRLPNAEEAVT